MTEQMVPPEEELFFRKDDPNDLRVGEVVTRCADERQRAGALEGADVAILGCPEDRGVVANGGRAGAARAPRAVRKAFYKLTPGFRPSLTDLEIVDLGDIDTEGLSLEEVHHRLSATVAHVAARGVLPMVLGGGHDLSYPVIAGLTAGLALGQGQLGVINVDSHLDVRDMSLGITSGTPFYRLLTELDDGALSGRNLVEYAVQESHNAPYYYGWLRERHAAIFTLKHVQGRPLETFLQALQIAGEGPRNVAVSVDIDVGRSTDAPGASASNANGLTAQDLEKVAYVAGRTERVSILDIMEVCPPLDQDGRTAALAAAVMFWFLKGMCERR